MSRWLRPLVSFVTLVGLVVGVPLVLVRTAPAPWSLDGSVIDALLGRPSTAVSSSSAVAELIVVLLAAIVWVAWARLAASVALALWCVARGVRMPRSRLLGATTQRAALSLVAGLSMMSAASGVVHAQATEPVRTVEVAPGDTLSGLAAELYGDATAWPLLWEANQGAELDGRVFDDPNLILPGWDLVVPEAPVVVPAESAPESAPAAIDGPVLAHDDVRPDRVTPVDVTPVVVVGPVDTPADTPAEVPVTTAPAPTLPPAAALPLVPPPSEAATADTGALVAEEEATASGRAAAGLVGAVLLAGGALALVEARRRRWWRGATAIGRPLPVSPAAARLEGLVRAASPRERLVRLDLTVRAAARALVSADPPSTACVVTAVVMPGGRIDLTLTADAPSAAPFVSYGSGWWRLPADVDDATLAQAATGAGMPCPLLVHLGTADGGDLFVDLEALGVLAVDGDDHAAIAAFVDTLASSLAVSPFADAARLVGCGLGDDVFAERDDATVVETADAAVDVAAMGLGSLAGLTAAGVTTFALRARHPHEVFEPAVVLLGAGAADEAVLADVVELTARPGRGLAAVVAGPVPGARARVMVADGCWSVDLGSFTAASLALTPVTVAADEIAAVRELLDASRRPLEAVAVPPLAPLRRRSVEVPAFPDDAGAEPDPVPTVEPFREQPWRIIVRILGPVEVHDADGRRPELTRSKSAELLAWLATHRERASRSRARAALWDTAVRDATFANVVSDLRRALARLVPPPDGGDWLARTLTDDMPLHEQVVTDADLLAARLAHARGQAPGDAVDTLREGLAWVRGLPFSGDGYLWPDGEGETSRLVLLVTTAATEMARTCLALDDVDGVMWATGRGLAVLPGHEELVGLRMRAHAQRGDHAGVRAEWDSYQRALDSDPWGDNEPSPKLVALRRDLLTPSTAGAR